MTELTPTEPDLKDLITPEKKEETEFDRDLKFARDNMIELLNTGQQATQELASIADQSQNDRCYERLAILLKSVSEMNKDFIELSRAKRDEQEPKIAHEEEAKTVNNNLFVGSFGELQAMLSQLKEKE